MTGSDSILPSGPTGPDPSPEPPSEAERQRAVDLLCEAFAADRIGIEEFEHRVEAAHAAPTPADLARLTRDLEEAPAPPGQRSAGPPARGTTMDAAPAEQNVIVGVLGGGKRRGAWTPARINWAVCVMGGVELDFREAVLPAGTTEVKIFAFWGGCEVIVPPDIRVECSGVGIMGGFDHHQTTRCTTDPDAPLLRVGGWALMGGINVVVRHPGESARDARQRRKEERRRLRDARGRGSREDRRLTGGSGRDAEPGQGGEG